MTWDEYWAPWSTKMGCIRRKHEWVHRQDYLNISEQMVGELKEPPQFLISINWFLAQGPNGEKGLDYFPSIKLANHIQMIGDDRALDLKFNRLFYNRMAQMADLSESDKYMLQHLLSLLDNARS